MNKEPKIGIGVMVLKDGKVLIGKREGSHGEGEYSFTGGHFDYMESFEECARREVSEEAGIEIENIRFVCVANIKHYDPKHYVLIGLAADWKSGEPKVLEPDKCESWGWYDIEDLPHPMFIPSQYLVDSFKTKQIYFDH